MENNSINKCSEELKQLLDYPLEKMEDISKRLIDEMIGGLESKSSLAMIPSYITKLPTGKEEGFAYALDVGGTNLRVVGIQLDGNGGIIANDQSQLVHKIPKELQEGNGNDLFNLFAESVTKVTKKGHLGVTFSFPVDQKSRVSGYLLRWTKGFTASGVVGNDICELLNKSLEQQASSVHVSALINDTVGTLITGAYVNPGEKCVIGLILGTGANTCYWEKLKNIKKFTSTHTDVIPSDEDGMVINMESGNFGTTHRGVDLPLTEFDEVLDALSNNKGSQLLEKQISGMFLGEIVRLVLRKYINQGTVLANSKDALLVPYGFETNTVSEILTDTSSSLTLVEHLLKQNGINQSTQEEREFVKLACFLVGKRAAALASIQIASILRHLGQQKDKVVVAIDGSVFEKFTGFKANMEQSLIQLLGENEVSLKLVKDGSGIGAALAAFVAL